MQLVQLFINLEAAHDTVDELGELGLVQFRDVREKTRKYRLGLRCTFPSDFLSCQANQLAFHPVKSHRQCVPTQLDARGQENGGNGASIALFSFANQCLQRIGPQGRQREVRSRSCAC